MQYRDGAVEKKVQIGVSEPTDTPRRYSLQLGGTGTSYADFTWQAPQGKTDGKVNANQAFGN